MSFDKKIWLGNSSVTPGNMCKFTLHLDRDKCDQSLKPSDPANVEFPTVHPYRCVYVSLCSSLLEID